MINEEPILIRESLHNALVTLRSVSERKVLWVDAICINQGSVAERNLQVRQMNRIYAYAKLVDVWLGAPTPDSHRGINFLRSFENISSDGWGPRDAERTSIEGFRRLTATDPKDKIIGPLGLIDQSSGLVVEYDLSVEKIYRNAFAAALKEGKDINPLGLIKELPTKRNPRLPSWVTDFEIHSEAGSDDFDSLSKPIWARTKRCFNASLTTMANQLQFQTKVDDSILVVEGIEFDRVKVIGVKAPGWDSCGPIHAANRPWKEVMRACLSQWRTMIASEEGDYLTGESREDAFWRTVLTDLKQGSAVGYQRLEPHDLKSLMRLETDQGIEDLLLT
ncbi:hypothetical protein CI238_04598 [Colletotrichum incanum]|uniref:Heterokaryon incompatibility domain-containing protein n=1 Tax=Colletotrichum incanum TaxID=1573173 RepID=A0A162N447_COLIC|nr:hypothetical protein CI238_04598 [Colletotrichum incanum]